MAFSTYGSKLSQLCSRNCGDSTPVKMDWLSWAVLLAAVASRCPDISIGNTSGSQNLRTARETYPQKSSYRQLALVLSVFQSPFSGLDGPVITLQSTGSLQSWHLYSSPSARFSFSTPSFATWPTPIPNTQPQYWLGTISYAHLLVLDSPCLPLLCFTTWELGGRAPYSLASPLSSCPIPFCFTSEEESFDWLASTLIMDFEPAHGW